MKEYILLFRGGSAERMDLSPEQIEAHMKRWQDWIGSIAQSGKLVGAQPLTNDGKIMKGRAKKISDGPYVEGKEILGGYVIVKVDNFDEALHISADCPNLEFDSGTVEVREIGTMPAM